MSSDGNDWADIGQLVKPLDYHNPPPLYSEWITGNAALYSHSSRVVIPKHTPLLVIKILATSAACPDELTKRAVLYDGRLYVYEIEDLIPWSTKYPVQRGKMFRIVGGC